MLRDFSNPSSLPSNLPEYDVCIVGAGAAGITLAVELGKRGAHIALCEAGGLDFTDESQALYEGEISGDPYLDLDASRLRYLGGATNHWAGWCRPFEPIDFERGHLGEHYEWPIEYAEVERYIEEACSILEIGNDFQTKDRALNSEIKSISYEYSPPVRFGTKYRDVLAQSENIDLFLNANFIDVSGTRKTISRAAFANYAGDYLELDAKAFVFSMGGIENSRYLAWLSTLHGNAFFDDAAPIGKYWMEHPHFTLGEAIVEEGVSVGRFYSLTEAAQNDRGILGCGLRVESEQSEPGGLKSLLQDVLCVAPTVGGQFAALADKHLICGGSFWAAWEQAPDLSSEVGLSEQRDRFGIPRVDLRWKKNPIDRKTVLGSVMAFNDWLMEEDIGRIRLRSWLLDDEDYPAAGEQLGGCHHMGGTRMAGSVKYGVVDRDCRVFGSDNLYMAGSSIFTTSGHGNPTLPIIQFTLRLRDHLASIL